MKKLLIRLAAIMLCICLGCASFAFAEAPDVVAYSFSIQLDNDETFVLSEQLGKVVFINFWATWCGPCVYEMPALDQLAAHYVDADDVVFVAINVSDDPATISAFMQEKGFTMPVGYDTDQMASWIYGVDSIPMTFIFNPDGMVDQAFVGIDAREGVEGIYNKYVEIIESLRPAAQ